MQWSFLSAEICYCSIKCFSLLRWLNRERWKTNGWWIKLNEDWSTVIQSSIDLANLELTLTLMPVYWINWVYWTFCKTNSIQGHRESSWLSVTFKNVLKRLTSVNLVKSWISVNQLWKRNRTLNVWEIESVIYLIYEQVKWIREIVL